MTRTNAMLALLSLIVCSACSPTAPPAVVAPAPAATTAPVLTEQKFRSGMAIEDVAKVVYRDEAGADIDFPKFLAAVTAGRSFSKVVDADKSVATMTINPVKTATRPEPPKNAALNIPVASAMPALAHADLTGRIHRLDDGQTYTVLSFFFADCVPCIQEIPQLNALQAQGGKLQIISVTFDDPATARRFVGERGLKLPVVADAQDYIDALGVSTYPTLVLVSPEGRLIGARTSYQPAPSLEAGVKELQDWLASVGVRI